MFYWHYGIAELSSQHALDATRYASLRTFRLDGSWVETPIWFARGARPSLPAHGWGHGQDQANPTRLPG